MLSNRAMLLWVVAAALVAFSAANMPDLSQALKMTSLNVSDWMVALLTPIITTSWWEASKLLAWRRR